MKSSFVALTFSLFFLSSEAQLSIGPKLGLNISMVKTNDPNIVIDPFIPALNFGALVNYKFKIPVAIQTEIFFSGEGTRLKQVGDKTVYNEKDGYLNIPLFIQFRPAGGFYIEAGPQLGFLLYAKEEANGTTTDVKSEENSTKFSGCMGIGFQFKHGFGIGARYAIAFNNVNKDATYTSKGNVFSLNIFYAFKLKKK